MANILYLVHRIPYPPNKGDKVRSHHLLRHLSSRHRVFLGTFIDDPQDEAYIGKLAEYCVDSHVARITPRTAKLRSLSGLLSGEALTLPYYRNRELLTWVEHTVRNEEIDAAVIFSSAMAQYVSGFPALPNVVDFVDVDSEKWTQYAPDHRWPMSLLYLREGQRLLAFEREIAHRALHSFFVTENETALFLKRVPDCQGLVSPMCNGVDADFFSPLHDLFSPYAENEIPLVFTGAMDYWPNVDAVTWFARDVLPTLVQGCPAIRFYIVGRNPTPEVKALANDRVVVTGGVADIRPYLRFARMAVAPLRIARGIQNKVLEAMAMGIPVVTSRECAEPIDAVPGWDFLTAGTADEYQHEIEALLNSPDRAGTIGRAARAQILARYSWDAHLSRIDRYLEAL